MQAHETLFLFRRGLKIASGNESFQVPSVSLLPGLLLLKDLRAVSEWFTVSGQQHTLDSLRKSRRKQTHDTQSLPQNLIVSWGHPMYTALQTEAHDGSADISKAAFRHMEMQRGWWGVERFSGWRDLAWVEGVEMHPREKHSNLWCRLNSSFHFWTQHYYRHLLQAIETPNIRGQKYRVQTAVLVEWPYSGESLDCVGLEFMTMGSWLLSLITQI